MSVIFFQSEELANVAIAATRHIDSSDSTKRTLNYWCSVLEVYSMANACAYNTTYSKDPDKVDGFTKEEIMKQVESKMFGTVSSLAKKQGTATATLLSYNAVSNGGRDFLAGCSGACRGLLEMINGVLCNSTNDGYGW